MPKPKSKSELLTRSQENYTKLIELIDSYSQEDLQTPFPEGKLNRNVRDVVAHLHHWHLMFLNWYEVGMSGEKPDMPAKGYTWLTMPALNKEIRQTYQDEALAEVRKMLDQSFNQVVAVIKSHTDTELFEKQKYHWTGSTSLGMYLISNTSSHYDWAYKLIKRSLKQKK